MTYTKEQVLAEMEKKWLKYFSLLKEKPTTSTEWAKEFYKLCEYDGELNQQELDMLELFNKALTTRTNELLGAMSEMIGEDEEEDYAGEGDIWRGFESNELRAEQRSKLQVLRQKYSV